MPWVRSKQPVTGFHIDEPPMTMNGSRACTSCINGTTVAGVRAVATVNRPPRSSMMQLSMSIVPRDNNESSPSNVPSRSLTYSVPPLLSVLFNIIVAKVLLLPYSTAPIPQFSFFHGKFANLLTIIPIFAMNNNNLKEKDYGEDDAY